MSEPGAILITGCSSGIGRATGGPYSAYHEAVAKGDAETDESFLAGRPEQVAKAIERASRRTGPGPVIA